MTDPKQHAPAQLTWQQKRDAVIAKGLGAVIHWYPVVGGKRCSVRLENMGPWHLAPMFEDEEAAWTFAYESLFPTTTAPQEGYVTGPDDEVHDGPASERISPQVASVEPRRDALPCPFCGSSMIRVGSYCDGAETGCSDCHVSVAAFNPDARQKSLDKWNTRAASPSPVSTEEQPPSDASVRQMAYRGARQIAEKRMAPELQESDYDRGYSDAARAIYDEISLRIEASAAPSVSGEGQQEAPRESMVVTVRPSLEDLWNSLASFLASCPRNVCGAPGPLDDDPIHYAEFCLMVLRKHFAAATPPPALPEQEVSPSPVGDADDIDFANRHMTAALSESGELPPSASGAAAPELPDWDERTIIACDADEDVPLAYEKARRKCRERQLLAALQRVERVKAQRDAAQFRIAHLESEIARVGVEFDGSGVLLNIRADALEAEVAKHDKGGGILARQCNAFNDEVNRLKAELSAVRQQRGKGFEEYWKSVRENPDSRIDRDLARETWQAACGAQEWIPVERELPKIYDRSSTAWKISNDVLTILKNGSRGVMLLAQSRHDGHLEWLLHDEPIEGVTHWQPLPAPPAPRGSDQK